MIYDVALVFNWTVIASIVTVHRIYQMLLCMENDAQCVRVWAMDVVDAGNRPIITYIIMQSPGE